MSTKPTYTELEKQVQMLHSELSGYRGSEKDITARIERYRQLAENINDVTYQLDTEGYFTYISRVVEYKTDFKPEEIIGKHFNRFAHPDDLQSMREKFRERVSENDFPPKDADFRALKKTGDYLWVRASSRRLRQDGKVIGLIGVWRDISERKKAEEELKQSYSKLEQKVADSSRILSDINYQLEQEIHTRKEAETAARKSGEHHRSLMEAAANFAVYRLIRSENNPFKLRVVFVSPSIKDILGVSDADDLEKWNEAIHPEDQDRVLEANTLAFDTGKFNEIFRCYHARKEEWRWIHAVSTGVAEASGHTKYVNGILIDVTEQKRAEEALKASEQECELKSQNLEEVNTALRVLLRKLEKDNTESEEKILHNLKEIIFPSVKRLKKTDLNNQQRSMLNTIHANLSDLFSSFAKSLSSSFSDLTQAELQVSRLIQQGYSTKEITTIHGISHHTVNSYRRSIRKKLGLTNKKGANLRSFLLALHK